MFAMVSFPLGLLHNFIWGPDVFDLKCQWYLWDDTLPAEWTTVTLIFITPPTFQKKNNRRNGLPQCERISYQNSIFKHENHLVFNKVPLCFHFQTSAPKSDSCFSSDLTSALSKYHVLKIYLLVFTGKSKLCASK